MVIQNAEAPRSSSRPLFSRPLLLSKRFVNFASRRYLANGLLASELAFGGGDFPQDPRVALAGEVYCLGKRFEQGFDNMVGFITIQQFKVEVAARRIGKALEEFAGQSKTENARHVLRFLSSSDHFIA